MILHLLSFVFYIILKLIKVCEQIYLCKRIIDNYRHHNFLSTKTLFQAKINIMKLTFFFSSLFQCIIFTMCKHGRESTMSVMVNNFYTLIFFPKKTSLCGLFPCFFCLTEQHMYLAKGVAFLASNLSNQS